MILVRPMAGGRGAGGSGAEGTRVTPEAADGANSPGQPRQVNRTGTGRDAGPESGGGQDDAARPAVLAVAAGRAGCPRGGGGPGGLSSAQLQVRPGYLARARKRSPRR